MKSVKSIVANTKRLPDGVDVFVFGSACYRIHPNDIDMLFIYDANLLPPQSAYSAIRPLIVDIQNKVSLSVHSVILTRREASDSRFVDEVEPIRLRPTGNFDLGQPACDE